MLSSPRDVVVGASATERTVEFLSLFGFERSAEGRLPADAAQALYGLDGPTDEVLMAVAGADRGRIRVVATPHPARSFAPFDPRPFAIDLYSFDIEKSVALAADAGYHTSPVADHRFGPVVIREVEITGPDSLVVTLLEMAAGRRSSILDSDPGRLHSEVHAFVWSASGLDGLLPYWEERGLVTTLDAVLDTPGLGALVGVPEEEVSMRLVVLADPEGRAVRTEFVDFLGRTGPVQPTLPLAAGLHAPAFEVADLEAAAVALAPASVGEAVTLSNAVHPRSRAATVEAPGGQRIEIWERL
jgi:hypothetical protein